MFWIVRSFYRVYRIDNKIGLPEWRGKMKVMYNADKQVLVYPEPDKNGEPILTLTVAGALILASDLLARALAAQGID